MGLLLSLNNFESIRKVFVIEYIAYSYCSGLCNVMRNTTQQGIAIIYVCELHDKVHPTSPIHPPTQTLTPSRLNVSR